MQGYPHRVRRLPDCHNIDDFRELAKRRLPLLDEKKILGAYAVPSDGLAKAVRACEAMARSVASSRPLNTALDKSRRL